jgi:serine/threonine protein kinase
LPGEDANNLDVQHVMTSQGYEEERLQHWFPRTNLDAKPERFSENDVREITRILETLENGIWSRIPRTYIVLRLIGHLDVIESFAGPDCSDMWFPFTKVSLPTVLRPHAADFLEAQKLVCSTRALNLERTGASHGHFRDRSEIPLKKIGELGKGGSGFVERVISTITHKEYALKLIKRGQTFRKDKTVLRNYEKELANLKKISHAHRHIIELVGSYTDPLFVGILFPVADCNLAEFIETSAGNERRWLVRTYFGCLASALSFLHDNRIRHKDIKPQNILITDNEPRFTDFGLAVDWSELGHSTTLGPTGMTPQYGAPEVAACEPRNSSSDVWSLGCVFIEMWALLKGATAKSLEAFTIIEGQCLPYHSKDAKLPELLDHIKGLHGPVSDLLPRTWIEHMIQRERGDRWSAHTVLESIQDYSEDPSTPHLYIGRCCFSDEDTAESVCSHASTDTKDPVIDSEISERGASSTDAKSPAALPSTIAAADIRTEGDIAFGSTGVGSPYNMPQYPSIRELRRLVEGRVQSRIHNVKSFDPSLADTTSKDSTPDDVVVAEKPANQSYADLEDEDFVYGAPIPTPEDYHVQTRPRSPKPHESMVSQDRNYAQVSRDRSGNIEFQPLSRSPSPSTSPSLVLTSRQSQNMPLVLRSSSRSTRKGYFSDTEDEPNSDHSQRTKVSKRTPSKSKRSNHSHRTAPENSQLGFLDRIMLGLSGNQRRKSSPRRQAQEKEDEERRRLRKERRRAQEPEHFISNDEEEQRSIRREKRRQAREAEQLRIDEEERLHREKATEESRIRRRRQDKEASQQHRRLTARGLQGAY